MSEDISNKKNKEKSKDGYIYIYKCIVGSKNDICKVGKTKHFKDGNDRLAQHLRTTYYGFTPYVRFDTNEVIATGFKVSDKDEAERLIKNVLKDKKLSNTEIYNIDYLEGIEKIYNELKNSDLFSFQGIYRDGISTYEYLEIEKKYIIDEYKNYENTDAEESGREPLGKDKFIEPLEKLWKKYKDNFPQELVGYICKENNKKDYIKECNYVKFGNKYVLNINYSYENRKKIMSKIQSAIQNK